MVSNLLGVLRIDSIRLAPWVVPQFEVTFGIDANGTLKVSAQDMSTGKPNQVTIAIEQSRLSQANMVQETEKYKDEDGVNMQKVEAISGLENDCFSKKSTFSALFPCGTSWDEADARAGSGRKFYHHIFPGLRVAIKLFYVAIITSVIHYCMGALEVTDKFACIGRNGCRGLIPIFEGGCALTMVLSLMAMFHIDGFLKVSAQDMSKPDHHHYRAGPPVTGRARTPGARGGKVRGRGRGEHAKNRGDNRP